jgi:hypothetical protein
LLNFILIKIEFHSRPLSVGSHAKKERGYPIRVLISIVPSYTTDSPTPQEIFLPVNFSMIRPKARIDFSLSVLNMLWWVLGVNHRPT